MNRKELNVKWVSETIGEDYKNWRAGDIVNINAMTGTGKTYFIIDVLLENKVECYEKLIYICNRIELKRQVKIQLLEKYNMEAKYFIGDEEFFDNRWIQNKNNILFNFEWLDELNEIRNVTISSYHKIANTRLHRLYDQTNYFYLDQFQYIVCDECQFYLTDSGFNQKTLYAFDELVSDRNQNSIIINLSATMDEIGELIEEKVDMWKGLKDVFSDPTRLEFHNYETGIDYSYLNVKYFKDIDTIVKKIYECNGKWLIFVTSMQQGNDLRKEFDNLGISCEFIRANKESEEKKNIAIRSTFEARVLIATKCIDNGVNIKDISINNIVIMAWHKITFIQELGRLRLNIKQAHEVNLFIRCASKKSFENLINGNPGQIGYKEKFKMIELFESNLTEFRKKYNDNLAMTAKDIFYLNRKNQWCINKLGKKRLEIDNAFAERMIEEFKSDKDFAFIKEQLSWLGLEDAFNKENLIDEEFDDVNMKDLEMFLGDSYENEVLFTKDYFIETITAIIENDKNLRLLFNKLGSNGNRQKGQTMFNKLFKELFESGLINGNYVVSSSVKKKTVNGKRKNFTYWIITKVEN